MFRRLVRIGVVVAIVGGLLGLAQPAFALSSTPDSTWGVDGKVYALARSGDVMYVGGSFKKAIDRTGAKTPVANLIAVDITTGSRISSFAPSVLYTQATTKPEVDALALSSDGSTLFIGGKFDTVDGQPRQNFAAVDTATGTQASPIFTASPTTKVQALLVGHGLVYLGGTFDRVNGVVRTHLAAVSETDGTLSTAWAPSATAGTDPCPTQFPTGTNCGPTSNGGTGNVHSMAFTPDGNSIYIGGNFYYMNGMPRNALARVSATTGTVDDWRVPWATIPSESTSNPYRGPNVVWAILPTITRLYIAWGRTPNGFSAFNNNTTTTTGECSNLPMGNGCAMRIWNVGTNGNSESLALSPDGSRLFVGGHFGTGVLDQQFSACGSSVWFHGLVSVNPATGAVFCDWVPQPVPFGGTNAPGSHANPPQYIGSWAMQMTDNALFVGGFFTAFSGVPQSGFARFTLVGSPPPPPPVPSITSFTPPSGPPGTTVTVTGSAFTGATSVSFGATPAASFTVDSDTQITATVPVGAKTAPIRVTTAAGTGSSPTNFKVTVVVSSFSPNRGPVGTTVTVTGVGFTNASGVLFGSTAATTFTVDSDTQITTTVPAGAVTGLIKVTVPSNGAGKSATSFTVTTLAIQAVTPNSGAIGDQVVITGSGFTGVTQVQFAGTDAAFIVDSDSQITTTVPAGATSGFVTVTSPNGTVQSPSTFTVT
jgi:hypothetical protein